jgi:amino acid permease
VNSSFVIAAAAAAAITVLLYKIINAEATLFVSLWKLSLFVCIYEGYRVIRKDKKVRSLQETSTAGKWTGL